jgi:release factor glutamine methyltransferase
MAYILEQKEFWSLELTVSKDTLIPRPETEHLIEWVLDNLPHDDMTIADLGTGSGAIAIALAHERPTWTIHATDSSLAALAIAIKNSQQHKLSNIEFYNGHWCEALPHQQYAAIISNPPYIAEDDHHLGKLTFEPYTALVAKDNGFADFKIIINQAKNYLRSQGILVLERGYDQASMLTQLLNQAGFQEVNSYCDLAKKIRFIIGRI